jgi:16S rRNA (guanine527-N7)-methyltransferase
VSPSDASSTLRLRAEQLFSVDLTNARLAKLNSFLDLVEAWSRRMNLVGPATRDELVERHVLDSLAPVGLLGTSKEIVDYGSGAGFPAIPLAVLLPRASFHLVEPRSKRCSFLRHVARTLSLKNVAIWESRGEGWRPPAPTAIDVAIGRAVAVDTLAGLAAEVLPVGGRLLVMRKQGAAREIEGYAEVSIQRYRLPRGERHEVAEYRRS